MKYRVAINGDGQYGVQQKCWWWPWWTMCTTSKTFGDGFVIAPLVFSNYGEAKRYMDKRTEEDRFRKSSKKWRKVNDQ